MRRGAAVLVGVIAVAGCVAPFAWSEDDRVPDPQLPAAAAPAEDSLAKAAEYLDRGDEAAALPHLRAHVRSHPEAVVIRAHLAELLFRAGQAEEARGHFERYVADAQRLTGAAHERLVHCHTRLMAIAEDTGDAYHEHLHRGIGLVLLVKRWDAERPDEVAAEQTLTQAASALRAAVAERPGDARGHLYLAEAYRRLGQATAARTALRMAKAGLPDAAVTATEREWLREIE
jgi:cytochrome c-type biogenesis protein CcmH/NrfG